MLLNLKQNLIGLLQKLLKYFKNKDDSPAATLARKIALDGLPFRNFIT